MMRAHWLGFGLLLLDTSGCLGPADECDIGAMSCSDGIPATCQEDCSDLGCSNHWQVGSVYQRGEPDPPGGRGATVCADPGDGTATCVPEAAKVDSLCDGVQGPLCAGTTLVECSSQYAVFKTACASCSVETAPTCDNCSPTPHGVCHGYLGDSCAADSDCAAGLVCHNDTSGQRTCSLPCAVEASSDSNAAPSGATSAQCYAAFNSDSTAISGYSEVNPVGRLSCIAGYCEWAQ
jgi:hypothetical protein